MFLPKDLIIQKILEFLKEDIGQGDITTYYTIPSNIQVEAEIIVKEEGVIAGIEEATTILQHFNFQVEPIVKDGSWMKPNNTLMKIKGDARTLLALERTLLNLVSRMSGIATTTRLMKTKLSKAGFKTKIASTRKTAPGLLYFDKKAVEIGGGDTHRLHLDDLILIKDNHIAVVGNLENILEKLKQTVSFSKKIEVEVTNGKDALKAAQNGADIILLDNFSTRQLRKTIELLKKKGLRHRILLEASGGITKDNIMDYAKTGVDIVSLGELTDSTKSLDISLEVKKVIRDKTKVTN
jgi:nicotinate-nucleotide pyrophosphorylase (carboxylating)